MVTLLDSGRNIEDICPKYDLNDGVVLRWRRKFTNETGGFKDELTLVYEQEINFLKKQLKDTKE
ncbi:MAG: transposase [Flavobacteriaceae bacterium]|nr:transposase [Flavobacteriaceae bacterium]